LASISLRICAAAGFAASIRQQRPQPVSPPHLSPVDLKFRRRSLYYLAQGGGAVFRVQYMASWRILPVQRAGYSVNESGGTATITVTRTGDTSSAATVDYSTSNGTASDRSDYTTASGTLTFAAGVTSRIFSVLVADDVYVEANETVNIMLSNAAGGPVLGTPNTAR